MRTYSVDQISNQAGSVLDIPPAAVMGNVFNREDPEEEVLGYVQAVAKDTGVAFTSPIFLTEVLVEPYCNSDRRRNSFPPFPPECYDCLLFETGSYERPAYWKDEEKSYSELEFIPNN